MRKQTQIKTISRMKPANPDSNRNNSNHMAFGLPSQEQKSMEIPRCTIGQHNLSVLLICAYLLDQITGLLIGSLAISGT